MQCTNTTAAKQPQSMLLPPPNVLRFESLVFTPPTKPLVTVINIFTGDLVCPSGQLQNLFTVAQRRCCILHFPFHVRLLSLYRSLSVSHLILSFQSPGLVISCVWVKPFRCGFHFLFDFGSYLSLTFCFLIVCTCILFFPRVLIAVFHSLCGSIC